jgi:3-oxoacyl-[acyl-carrier protein] reductase
MDLGLAGRAAIVTGASRGIGKACAAELAAEGADVVLVSKDRDRNAAACAEIARVAKGRVVGAPADLNDEAALRAVFERTMAELGRLDILVNCGAVVDRGDFFSFDEAKWARLFEAVQMGAHRQRARRRGAPAAARGGVGRA